MDVPAKYSRLGSVGSRPLAARVELPTQSKMTHTSLNRSCVEGSYLFRNVAPYNVTRGRRTPLVNPPDPRRPSSRRDGTQDSPKSRCNAEPHTPNKDRLVLGGCSCPLGPFEAVPAWTAVVRQTVAGKRTDEESAAAA